MRKESRVEVYVPAMFGSLAVAASGGTLLGVFAAAAIAGGAGGLIGAALARFIGHEHAKHLDEHLNHGGLLLWVRTRDADREQKALEILRRHSAHDVHLHQIPERACKESDVPRERPRVVLISSIANIPSTSSVACRDPDTGPAQSAW